MDSLDTKEVKLNKTEVGQTEEIGKGRIGRRLKRNKRDGWRQTSSWMSRRETKETKVGEWEKSKPRWDKQTWPEIGRTGAIKPRSR